MTTNREGLTWDEWVAAAGHARFNYYGDLVPYSSSESYTVVQNFRASGKTVRASTLTQAELSHAWPYQLKSRWSSRRNYPLQLRKAWQNGEDPSEYRNTAPKRVKES